MQTIDVDFHALTEEESIWLGTPWSLKSIEQASLKPGDWTWLTDGEMQVGARIAEDAVYWLVGVPAWDTLVYLDDELDRGFEQLWIDLQSLLQSQDQSPEREGRVLQLLTLFENKAPEAVKRIPFAGYVNLRRALALLDLGYPGLALIAARDAVAADPDYSSAVFVYLDLLRRTDSTGALREVEDQLNRPRLTAEVLAACINILSDHADRLVGEDFVARCRRILDLCQRFESAPDRDRILAATRALVCFDQGLAHLGLGESSEAHACFQAAGHSYPTEPAIHEALGLSVYDTEARQIAARVRERFRPRAA
jgi:hypothetical protein